MNKLFSQKYSFCLYRAISNHELDELMKYIAVYFSAQRQHLFDKEFSIKTTIRSIYNRLKKLTHPYYSSITSVSGELSEKHDEIYELNKNFLQCDEIKNLYTMLDLMYKYTNYSLWYIEEMKIKKLERNPGN